MIKAAVIGIGAMGNNHARVYKELPDVTLVGLCDADEQAVKEKARQYNVPHATDLEMLLDQHQPDVVSIAVPTVHHFQVAEQTLKRGIHTLIEKPITATIEEGKKLIELAESSKARLMVGHIERFNPAISELKTRLNDGELGKVFRIQGRRMGPFPARIRDVGVIIDLASHDVDMFRYVLGEDINHVYAETAQGITTDREDMMDCVLRCSNGTVGTLNINWLTPTKIRELTITGSQGMFVVNYLTQELFFYKNDAAPTRWYELSVLSGVSEGTMTQLRVNRQEPLRAELAEFVNSIREERSPLVSGEDGLKALAAAQALVISGLEQRIVPVNEILSQ